MGKHDSHDWGGGSGVETLHSISPLRSIPDSRKTFSLLVSFQNKVDALLEAEAPFLKLMPAMMKLLISEEEEYFAKILQYSGSMTEGASMARIFQVGALAAQSTFSCKFSIINNCTVDKHHWLLYCYCQRYLVY